ncbi:MAG TPA: hypothetical protein PLT82_08430 [Candidatus Hydrogenedens sp.]|nr:hypothetical protein [Candidatus Hydrogenedens sp.]HOL20722.1 hypothetical protein [Candidatus Hydrogenedens sp.]HPP59142.1 hypothetical protein [Candidatus Hydrogenedens sp.]
MLKILIVSDSFKVYPIIHEIEALGHEVILLNDIDLLRETLLKNNVDVVLIDYEKTFKLSTDDVFEFRYFLQSPNETPIYILVEDINSKTVNLKPGYSGTFPYTHSVNMLNEFISNLHTMRI